MNNFAITLVKMQEFDRAEELLNENLSIRKKFYKLTPQRWADHYTESLVKLSFFLLLQKHYDQATALQEEALKIKEDLYFQNPQYWVESFAHNLSACGYSYFLQKQYIRAIRMELKSFNLIEKLFLKYKARWSYNYFLTLASLSTSYAINKQYKQATHFQDILKQAIHSCKDFPLLMRWIEDNFTFYISFELEKVAESQLIVFKSKLLLLEFLQKKSPHRWSDAFK